MVYYDRKAIEEDMYDVPSKDSKSEGEAKIMKGAFVKWRQ